jgi:uncharacterized protein
MIGSVLVLAKAPVPGRVKTRLCPPCTPDQAAMIAAAALADTLAAVRACRAGHRVLALDGTGDGGALDGVAVLPQRGSGLGQRIAAAFADTAGETRRAGAPDAEREYQRPIVQIGMDTPQVTPLLLNRALATLQSAGADAVFGPAADGGWWLLGLRDHRHAELVAGVPMSTPDTGRLTLAALTGAGLRVRVLPALIDVDVWADAVAVAAAVPHTGFASAVTAVSTDFDDRATA